MATTHRATGSPAGERPEIEQTYGVTFWIGLVLGWSIMAYAIWGAFKEKDGTNPTVLVRWVIGLALTHDLILAPIVTIVGLLLAWILPARVRGPIVAAFATTGLIVLFSWPLLRQFGHREFNNSAIPLDYTRNVTILITLVWLIAAATIIIRYVRDRSRAARVASPS